MRRMTTSVLAMALSLMTTQAQAQAQAGPSPIRADADAKAAAFVARMTLDEKVDQLLNVAPAIPRLNIPAYNWWTESLHGAIGAVPTTNFPEPIGLAATFDPALVHNVAGTISTEVRALHTLGRLTGHLGKIGTGLDTWSPNINIFRDPRWGRGQETYGEDPYLTAQFATAFVTGMQGPNPETPYVISTPKHFAVHSGPEPTRHVADVFVSKHDLEDTYLPAFRAALVDGHAGSVMCAYNSIDGQPACGSDLLLRDHLRGAWGFQGYVVSDCDAVTDISEHHKYAPDPAAAAAVALKAGVDNECNTQTLGGVPNLSARYKEAYARGLIGMDDIDRALIRLFSARLRNGDLPGVRTDATVPVSAIGTPEHQALALKTAIESLVLLKNDGTLPLKSGLRLAVIGPLADATRVLRGNYSSPLSAPPVSVVDGLRQAMPAAKITLVPFSPSITDGDIVPASAFITPDGKPGLRARYYNLSDAGNAAQPVLTRDEPGLTSSADSLAAVSDHHRTVWDGALIAPESGAYRMAVTGVKGALTIDGKPAVGAESYSHWGEPLKLVSVTLRKGERYPLHFETESGASANPGLFWKRVSTDEAADLKAGISSTDVVIAVVGLTSDLEGEEMPLKVEGFSGGDKTSLDLPADQRALLEQAKAMGKPLVVVVMNGSPIDLQWAKANAAAIVEAWYPGQSGGTAVAQVLSGQANPGGRLPLTFYRSLTDLPPFDDYAMKGRTYRYFSGTPVYPFGYGLSYTRFGYTDLKTAPIDGTLAKGLHVSVTIRNTGPRAGDEVAQLYLTPPTFAGAPRIALRGVQRLHLAAGAAQTISFDLSPRDLSFVDRDGHRKVMAGTYGISLGSGQPAEGVPTQSTSITIATEQALPL